jgi:hypothetical protein
MNRIKAIILIVVLIALSLMLRVVGLGSFTSVDEPFWLRQSANFYYALGQRAFQNTIYEYHPAVTTMWVITAGMLAYFPEYRTLEQGYLKPGKFDLFLPAHGKDPLQLLIVSRGVQVVLVVVLLVTAFLLLRRLLDDRSSFLAAALVSVSPFFLGQSRLLNHEAMLGLFILVSVLSMLVYIYAGRQLPLLIVSAAAGALAQLTKSSGILLFPVIILMLAVSCAGVQRGLRGRRVMDAAKTLGIWAAALSAAYVLFWPGMWVAPGEMLSNVYGNAFTYAFQGARLSVVGHVDAGRFGFDTLVGGLQFYVNDLIWRTTPITWIGWVLGIGIAAADVKRRSNRNFDLVVLYSMLLAIGYVLMFSVQHGPKPPHYTLTSYVAMDLIAGLGYARGWDVLARRFPGMAGSWATWGAAAGLVAMQAASAASAYPYYITYYDPVLEALQPGIQNPTLVNTGYGVGLDQAAAYLAQKPDAKDLTVMSANGYGSFSYYFPGHTIPINTFTLSDPQVLEIMRDSQYAVVDYYNQKRINLVSDLEGIPPEHTIWINGIEFLHIYRTSDFMARIGSTAP